MKRPMIGALALAALAVGGAVVVATSRNSSNTQAYQAPTTLESASTVPANAQPVVAPVPETAPPKVVVQERVVYRTAPARRRVVVQKRSTKKSVAIIGGSTVGGAVVGGLIGGKKGAVIGGVAGGTAGTVYDRKTRKKRRVVVQ